MIRAREPAHSPQPASAERFTPRAGSSDDDGAREEPGLYDNRRAIKILLPGGEIVTLLGAEVRFEPFYPESVRSLLPSSAAEMIALVCLDAEGREVARIKMDGILGYLTE